MIAIIDIETGGFSKKKNGLCTFAALFTDGLEAHSFITHAVRPYEREEDLQEEPGQLVTYKPEAMEVNGLSVEFLKKEGAEIGATMDNLIQTLLKYKVTDLVFHNAKFDLPWIQYLVTRFASEENINLEQKFLVTCTLILAREKLPNLKSHSLEALAKHFNIDQGKAHTAVDDCFTTLHLYKELVKI